MLAAFQMSAAKKLVEYLLILVVLISMVLTTGCWFF